MDGDPSWKRNPIAKTVACRAGRVAGAWLALLCLGLGACDPGWGYVVLNSSPWPDGIRFVVPDTEVNGIDVVIYANQFIASLSVELWVKNLHATPVVVRPRELRLYDVDGHRLGADDPTPYPITCHHDPRAEVTLKEGETCKMRTYYPVPIDKKKMRSLTLVHWGLARGGVPLKVIAFLKTR